MAELGGGHWWIWEDEGGMPLKWYALKRAWTPYGKWRLNQVAVEEFCKGPVAMEMGGAIN